MILPTIDSERGCKRAVVFPRFILCRTVARRADRQEQLHVGQINPLERDELGQPLCCHANLTTTTQNYPFLA